ncbi:MAG: branched-chain amino acid transport system II carrier protein [Alphaproteobacteria bacterium]
MKNKYILTAGFATFSMFFGSGNLVFPLLTGFNALSNYPCSILGFFITAVCVPFLGLFGITLYNGNRDNYFKRLGSILTFVLTLFMLSLMGPFGVIPRCINVAFGGIFLLSDLSPYIFNLCFCIILIIFVWKKDHVVNIIGIFLTPFKLGGIALLVILGLFNAGKPYQSIITPLDSFILGIRQGYQTMDLMASFFFASTIYEYLKKRKKKNDTSSIFKDALYASIIGASLLGIIYIGFLILGATYAPFLTNIPEESFLVVIAGRAIGAYAMPFIAFLLIVSCLATATILTSLFVDFMHRYLNKYLSRAYCIFITITISYILSLLGFHKLCSILGKILEFIYPLLIIYAIMQVVIKIYKNDKDSWH